MECERCGREVDETNNERLYRLGFRDDGTEYERVDGSFGEDDVQVCMSCLDPVSRIAHDFGFLFDEFAPCPRCGEAMDAEDADKPCTQCTGPNVSAIPDPLRDEDILA